MGVEGKDGERVEEGEIVRRQTYLGISNYFQSTVQRSETTKLEEALWRVTADVEKSRSLGQGRLDSYWYALYCMTLPRLPQTAVCYSSSPIYTPSHSPEVLLGCTLPHVCTVRLFEYFARG